MWPRGREVERRILRLLHNHPTGKQLKKIHAHCIRHYLNQSNQILSHFVSDCGSLDKMAYARLIFSQIQNPNLIFFNSMIKGYSLCGPFEESLHIFSSMKHRGIFADEYTYSPLLKSCSKLRDLRIGQGIHAKVLMNGFDLSSSVQIAILELYAVWGKMTDAEKVFGKMFQRVVIAWNLMILGFCSTGDIELGLRYFDQMENRDVVSWNTMISCLARSGRHDHALALFEEMRAHNFEPDEATIVTILPVCCHLGAVDIGVCVHSYTESSGLIEKMKVANSVIDFYCKSGDIETASKVFDKMPERNVVTWNTLILGFAYNGKGQGGVELFEEMLKGGIHPTETSFVGVLECCTHSGMVRRGQELFDSMIVHHEMQPKIQHYGCVVDMLGRNGRVEEAYIFIKRMPIEANASIWGSCLSACRTYGKVELAECVVKELIRIEPWNSGNYVLLSNVFAEEDKWLEVEEVRTVASESFVRKVKGSSLIIGDNSTKYIERAT